MRVVAPGKIVLIGEYAVLDGGPAVVAAVDRGVACDMRPGPSFQITTPDGDDRFVRPALVAAGAPAGEYRFTAWNPTATTTKAGLGGSAAATVAAVVAAHAAAGTTATLPEVEALARRVHHRVQGSGSGIDITASVWGGIRRVQGDRSESVDSALPVLVYSGTSARTGPRVVQYRALHDRTAFVAASQSAVDRFASDPLRAFTEAREALDQMTRAAGIAYWTPGLRTVVELAAQHGGQAKPSGAGGGDCAVALFPDGTQRSSFVTACRNAGLVVIPIHVAQGAHALKE
ncbi:MAG: phosphomevalonate kinase [Myxococcota bacterium]